MVIQGNPKITQRYEGVVDAYVPTGLNWKDSMIVGDGDGHYDYTFLLSQDEAFTALSTSRLSEPS